MLLLEIVFALPILFLEKRFGQAIAPEDLFLIFSLTTAFCRKYIPANHFASISILGLYRTTTSLTRGYYELSNYERLAWASLMVKWTMSAFL